MHKLRINSDTKHKQGKGDIFMKAIIMAGGFGSRLRPLTDKLPKPMLNICNRPMIDYCFSQLNYYGIDEVALSLGYRAEDIIEWTIGYKGIKTHFVIEDTPLGTLGGVKAAAGWMGDDFLVLSGDGLCDIDLNAMLNRHLATKAEVTIAVKMVDNPQLYGVAELSEDGFIKGFIEKPHSIKTPAFVNCGTYVVNKKALNYIQAEKCDFAKDLFPILVKENKLAYYIHRGYWQDIGDFKSYYQANFYMLNNAFFPKVKNIHDKRYNSKFFGENSNSLISETASVVGSVFESIIGHGSRLSSGSIVEKCIVVDNVIVQGKYYGCIISDEGCISIFDKDKEYISTEVSKIRQLSI